MKDMVVLGIGNRLMMDDGIGVYVAEELKKRNTSPAVRYVIGETDFYYCLSQIDEAAYVIIIDAACLGKEPGTISVIPLQQIFNNPMQQINVHESHILNEIKMVGRSIDGLFIGIEPYMLDYSFGLSSVLQTQYFTIADKIEKVITR